MKNNLKKIVTIIIVILASIFLLSSFNSGCFKEERKVSKQYYCHDSDITLASDIDIYEIDFIRTCLGISLAKEKFLEKYEMKLSSQNVYIYFYTLEQFEKLNPTNWTAFVEYSNVYIRIIKPVFGQPDIIFGDFAKDNESLQKILLHELYHLWSLDSNEDNANEFAEKVPTF